MANTSAVLASTPAFEEEAEIQTLLESVEQAHCEKAAAAIADHYSEDAVLFTLAPPLAVHGVNRRELRAWVDTWDGPLTRQPSGFRIHVTGDTAFCYGFYRLSGMNRQAGRQISFWMRATVCLLREEGVWRIAHEHLSVPFYMDGSLRPAFDLKP